MFRFLSVVLLLVLAATAFAANDQPVWRTPNKYPVIEQIEARRDSLTAIDDSLKALADARAKALADSLDDARLVLRPDWNGVQRPSGPDAFKIDLPHLPPVPQFDTGTCWAFSSTSLMESEVIRMTGQKIKLSEMWVVYWEYVEKVRRWIRQYGHSAFAQGSEDDAILDIYRKYGAVPKEAYKGVLSPDGRYDHEPLVSELRSWLHWARDNGVWDEQRVIAGARLILDAHLGAPPETFTWKGRKHSPRSFLLEVLHLDPDAYVTCVSRMERPGYAYYKPCLFDVPDNWRRKADYLNVPLDMFMKVLDTALKSGYTAAIGGDNSEPGLDGKYDAAIVPSWDIPSNLIDQGSREFRITSGQTNDDHGIHAVGMTREGGRTWYLIKDSNRSSRLGAYEGYYMFDADYVKLKMLTVMVHRDVLKGLVPGY